MKNSKQWIDALRSEYMDQASDSFAHWVSRASSPIEQVMIAKLLASHFDSPDQHVWSDYYDGARTLGVSRHSLILAPNDHEHSWGVLIQPTIVFDGFNITPDFGLVDFLVPPGQPAIAIAIELDGHEFHERTKHQASRDKRRDRTLHGAGWTVLRFSGSDVIKDPSEVFVAWEEAMAAESTRRGREW